MNVVKTGMAQTAILARVTCVLGLPFLHITDTLFTRSVGFAAKTLGVTPSGKDCDVRPFEALSPHYTFHNSCKKSRYAHQIANRQI